MRLVLDTDVLAATMRSPRGGSAELLRRIRLGQAVMLLNVPLALEYEAKCMTAEHRLASGLSLAEIALFLDRLISLAEPVQTYYRWRPQLRDPGDEMVLEAALNGRANTLVTFNARHFGAVPSHFGIEVLRPKEAIWRIRK